MEKIKQIFNDLQPLSNDTRDFSHHRLIGTLSAPEIPVPDFDLAEDNPIVLNQKNTDFCTAYAATEAYTVFKYPNPSLVDYLASKNRPTDVNYRASLAKMYGFCTAEEYINLSKTGKNAAINSDLMSLLKLLAGDYFDPLYQFSKIKQIRNEWATFGANTREAMLSVQKFGAILRRQSPFTFDEGKPTDRTRDELANWSTWPKTLDSIAAKNSTTAFFVVDGPNQPFDNIRSVLWQNKKKGIKSGIIIGLFWKATWGNSIIDDDGQPADYNSVGGHCVWVRGQKTINGKIYLVVQNSYGDGAGDKGLYYIARQVINKNVPLFGAYYFYPINAGDAQYHNENGIKLASNWLTKFFFIIKSLFKKHD